MKKIRYESPGTLGVEGRSGGGGDQIINFVSFVNRDVRTVAAAAAG